MMSFARLVTVALLALPACADESPDDPTWFGEVQGILAANCLACHSDPSANGAPSYFRLDRFVAGDGDAPEEAPLSDAFDMATSIVARAVDYESSGMAPMPPDSSLSKEQKAILAKWLANGAPKGTRDNHSPSAELLAPSEKPSSIDQELSLQFTSVDEDQDGLIVALGYRPAGSNEFPVLVLKNLPAGMTTTSMDAGLLASNQRVDIIAILDDGFSDDPAQNKTNVLLLGDLLVDHGDRGAAPTVLLNSPNGGATILGETEIRWTATDPDPGDVLSIDLDLVRLDAGGNEVSTTALAVALSNTPSSFQWDPSGVASEDGNGDPIPYKIRVTASDTGNRNTRSDDSDAPFTIAGAGGPTELAWENDIKPLFVTYCGQCHSQPALNPPLEYFRLDIYDASDPQANGDVGVYEQRSLVYQRLVVDGTMPPNAQPQPSAAEVAKIKEWIEAGAPLGGGTGDAPPTFTWITPNDTATTIAGSAQVTIEWSANDPEGLPLTGSIVMANISGAGNPMVVNCPTTLSGTSEVVASANIEDGSFVVTLPNTGKFCFEGTVTDAQGQTTSAISAFGVKF